MSNTRQSLAPENFSIKRQVDLLTEGYVQTSGSRIINVQILVIN